MAFPATPQRPTPGAFFNTPAPNRAGLFAPQPPPGAPQLPPAAALSPIERAARTINSMLDQDAGYQDFDTRLGQGFSGEYAIAASAAVTPFEEIKTHRIPDRILEQINRTQMHTSMGLFADINHAWVSIDNQLYLWDYTNPTPELIGYEENENAILSVKLVKPRAKVFVADISHLLVVATAAEVMLIAVQCERGPEGVHGVTLFKTGLSVPAKGLTVSSIAGSAKTGRIFFAEGRDNEDVYELNYQQEDRWFQSKCSKTNHVSKGAYFPPFNLYNPAKPIYVTQMEVDDSREVLYTLSSNGTIRVFHMKNTTTLDLAITVTLDRIGAMCTHIVPHQSEALGGNKMEIIGIDTVSASEASHVSLVATTSTGCRIFLSTTSGGYQNDNSTAPRSMQVRHIRFPPADSRNANQTPSSQLQPYQIAPPIGLDSRFLTPTKRARRYAPGSTFFFIQTSDAAPGHTLFLTAPQHGQETSPQNQMQTASFKEDAQILELTGYMQDIGLVTESFSASGIPRGFGNELAVQFDKPLCEFAIMTHTGIQTMRRRRLVDIFAAIIKSGGGSEGVEGDLRWILSQYGRAEATATALAVACGQGTDVGADLRVAQISDPEVLEYARSAFIGFGGKAQLNENATVAGLNVDNVRASPRHDGIAIYIARLVRSIWRTPIIKVTPSPKGPVLGSRHNISKLKEVQRALISLQDFLNVNKPNIDGLAGPEALGRASSRQDEVELQAEHRALTSLLVLINNIIEGISFVLFMLDERLEDLITLLPPDSQARVHQLTFEGLFSNQEGKELARALVKAIVSRNIAKGSNVETVAEALRRKCGSFCSSDDVIIFKAQENLKKATDARNSDRARMLLNDSMRLFEQVSKSLTDVHLTEAVDTYIASQFYAGAIRLCLKVAQDRDSGKQALSWIKDSRPSPDARETAYLQRTACYDLVFRVIEAVDLSNNNQSGAGVSPARDDEISKITRRREEAYDQINQCDDEVFQNYLYDWYIQQGWSERLLDIQSPFVIDYLERNMASDPAHADLLWRYHAHYNDFLSAAQVQFDLAKSDSDLTLEKRIEYLSRAKANASTRINSFSDHGTRNRQSRQELLRSISEHLDIANIQDDVLQKIRGEPRLQQDRREDVIKILDGKIQPLDELYHSYADQAGYYDICILIYHAADYRDLPDIRSTWTNLIEQIHQRAVNDRHQSPWELVALDVENIGRRVSLNENVFPVNVLLQALLQYHLEYYSQDGSAGLACNSITWPLDIFIKLNAPFETQVATLEALWYAQEQPFTGRNRKLLVRWIIYTIEEWDKASNRQGLPFGGAENAIGLADLLRVVLGANEIGRDTVDERRWVERGRAMSEKVEAAAR